jgi:hypothetical protein
MNGIIPINFILMANTIKASSSLTSTFDLKGSTVSRFVPNDNTGKPQTLKDLNFLQKM